MIINTLLNIMINLNLGMVNPSKRRFMGIFKKGVSLTIVFTFLFTNLTFGSDEFFKLAPESKFTRMEKLEFKQAAQVRLGVSRYLNLIDVFNLKTLTLLGKQTFYEESVFESKISVEINFANAVEGQLTGTEIMPAKDCYLFTATVKGKNGQPDVLFYCLLSKDKKDGKFVFSTVPKRLMDEAIKNGEVKFSHEMIDAKDRDIIDQYVLHETYGPYLETIDPWIRKNMEGGNYAVDVVSSQGFLYRNASNTYNRRLYESVLDELIKFLNEKLGVTKEETDLIRNEMLKRPLVFIPHYDRHDLPRLKMGEDIVTVDAHSSEFATYIFIEQGLYSEIKPSKLSSSYSIEFLNFVKTKLLHEIGARCGLEVRIDEGDTVNVLDDLYQAQFGKGPLKGEYPLHRYTPLTPKNLLELELRNDYAAGSMLEETRKRIFKKVMSLLVAGVPSIAVLAGCIGKTQSEIKTPTIVVVDGEKEPEQPLLQTQSETATPKGEDKRKADLNKVGTKKTGTVVEDVTSGTKAVVQNPLPWRIEKGNVISALGYDEKTGETIVSLNAPEGTNQNKNQFANFSIDLGNKIPASIPISVFVTENFTPNGIFVKAYAHTENGEELIGESGQWTAHKHANMSLDLTIKPAKHVGENIRYSLRFTADNWNKGVSGEAFRIQIGKGVLSAPDETEVKTMAFEKEKAALAAEKEYILPPGAFRAETSGNGDSQAISGAKLGDTEDELFLTANLEAGLKNHEKGEVYLDLRYMGITGLKQSTNGFDLKGNTYSVEVYIPEELIDESSNNGIQLFIKTVVNTDGREDWKSIYYGWKNLTRSGWQEFHVKLGIDVPFSSDKEANLSDVSILGVKLALGGQSKTAYKGNGIRLRNPKLILESDKEAKKEGPTQPAREMKPGKSIAREIPVGAYSGTNLSWDANEMVYGYDLKFWGGQSADNASLQKLDQSLSRLSAAGVQTIRVFTFCDLRAGIRFDIDNMPIGFENYVETGFRRLLEKADKYGIKVIPVLFDFTIADGKLIDGTGEHPDLFTSETKMAAFLKLFEEFVTIFKDDKRIAMIEILNEPEGISNVDFEYVAKFLKNFIDLVNRITDIPVTIGFRSFDNTTNEINDNVDFIQFHLYPDRDNPEWFSANLEEFFKKAKELNKPVLLGEIGARTENEFLKVLELSKKYNIPVMFWIGKHNGEDVKFYRELFKNWKGTLDTRDTSQTPPSLRNEVADAVFEELWEGGVDRVRENLRLANAGNLMPQPSANKDAEKVLELASAALAGLGFMAFPKPEDTDIQAVAKRIKEKEVEVFLPASIFPKNKYVEIRKGLERIFGDKLKTYQDLSELGERIKNPANTIVMTRNFKESRIAELQKAVQGLKDVRFMNFDLSGDYLADLVKDKTAYHNFIMETLGILLVARVLEKDEGTNPQSAGYRLMAHLLENRLESLDDIDKFIRDITDDTISINTKLNNLIKFILKAIPIEKIKMESYLKGALQVLWSA